MHVTAKGSLTQQDYECAGGGDWSNEKAHSFSVDAQYAVDFHLCYELHLLLQRLGNAAPADSRCNVMFVQTPYTTMYLASEEETR